MYTGNHSKNNAKKIGVMDFILIFVAVALIAFTLSMIYVFIRQGSIPDTLCTCVFAVLGGECGVMGWIKTNKDKQRDRQWEKEDAAGKEQENEN